MAQKTASKVVSSISKKEALTSSNKKRIAESKEHAVHTFDADGSCIMPLKELLEQHIHLHAAYAMLHEREWGGPRNADEPESAISGVVMDADIEEGGKPGEDATAELFCCFVWRLLASCRSGSTGGDARRMCEVIRAAVKDIRRAPRGTTNHFYMTYGLTDAIMRSYIELSRSGDVFNALSQQWRTIFASGGREALTAMGVNDGIMNDAREMCKMFFNPND